jgi:hypothetical protein
LCARSCGSGVAVAERLVHQTSTASVGVKVGRVLGLEAADLEAGFYGALLKAVGCGACGAVLTPFFVGQELALRLGGRCGVAERACRPWHPPLASRSGFAQPSLRAHVGRRVAGARSPPTGERRNPAGAVWDTVTAGDTVLVRDS